MEKRAKNLLLICLVSALFVFMSAGSALAASDSITVQHNSGSIKDQVDEYVNKLSDPIREPVQLLVDNVFTIFLIFIVLLIIISGAKDASAKRSNNVAGSAHAQKNTQHVFYTFCEAGVLIILVLFIANKYFV